MCDYSLYEFPNRLAKEGEELVTYRFPLGSLGLASAADLQNLQPKSYKQFWTVRVISELIGNRPSDPLSVCAICVPPGASLFLKDVSAEMQRDFVLGPEECGKFIETGLDAYRHRDAIRFANGQVVPLQHFSEGQRIRVLSLAPAGELVSELTF